METEADILRGFEEKLRKRGGKSRLDKVYSYYGTWSLPNHPQNPQLLDLVIDLVVVRDAAIASMLGRNRESPLFSLDSLEPVFTFSVESESDRGILDHLKMHYFILRELRAELIRSWR